MMKDLGLYLHIPFCKSKCHYCDFCSFPAMEEKMEAYCRVLLQEIDEAPYRGTVKTVYFGGGTPTTLPLPLFSSLLEALFKNFSIAPDAEITTECNPATADRSYLSSLRSLGVNRLSMGAQSMNDHELGLLGRIHTAKDTENSVKDARAAGFDNISLDIMLGIPDQTPKSLKETLRALVSLAPEHISAYGLKIEEGTPFFEKKETLSLPDEETERAFYMDTVDFLAQNGYARYEISNFAKKGFESRHNLRYWRREDYLGLGVAAYSCVGNKRFWNGENILEYLQGNFTAGGETLSEHDILCEKIMLGMRLDEGIDTSVLGNTAKPYIDGLLRYVPMGLVRQNGDRISFTSDGMYVSNTILAEILDFETDNGV